MNLGIAWGSQNCNYFCKEVSLRCPGKHLAPHPGQASAEDGTFYDVIKIKILPFHKRPIVRQKVHESSAAPRKGHTLYFFPVYV